MKLVFWRKPQATDETLPVKLPSPDPEQDHNALLMNVIYAEYARVPPTERPRCQWVMDAGMLQLVLAMWHAYEVSFLPSFPSAPLLLLGRPVNVRDGVEGIHLVRWEDDAE